MMPPDPDESDSDSDIEGFPSVDLSGVNFDVGPTAEEGLSGAEAQLSEDDAVALRWEKDIAFGDYSFLLNNPCSDSKATSGNVASDISAIRLLGECLSEGKYSEVLRSETARSFLEGIAGAALEQQKKVPIEAQTRVSKLIQDQVCSVGVSVSECVKLELLGIAALNLFLQFNYTGPSLDSAADASLEDINPHPCFVGLLDSSFVSESQDDNEGEKKELKISITAPKRNTKYQNAVLSELAFDGEWPCQVCQAPYFLLLARSILSVLSSSGHRPVDGWINSSDAVGNSRNAAESFLRSASRLAAVHIWNGRAVVAHERLLQGREPAATLWKEAEYTFQQCMRKFCPQTDDNPGPDTVAATVMLEWGLAQHHFNRPGMGRKAFQKAKELSGLFVEVTGAEGKRTKFQQKATAQMLVRATSAVPKGTKQGESSTVSKTEMTGDRERLVKGQMVEHTEESILMEKVKFEDDAENEVTELTVLDQAILLAMCLDVKNSNPADGLTGEEMAAFLSRVLDQHDDWMVYSTALLERAWLEFERTHARERSILQIQALADQHTNRLTITQSTTESIEESAPVQDRLMHIHSIVYPPRWSIIQDLADKYAGLGIVTSAAELFTQIEFWDDVVECYRRAGKVSMAEQIVRERLAVDETPKMWAALGDLTNDPEHYERAVELSKGRFSSAHVALGQHYFAKEELEKAATYYERAVSTRPLSPTVWFRLGTISMQLGRWDKALRCFSEVVQQEPEEADAWANVAAVHMHNKKPAEAYPALVESLKQNRSNWRVWVSKLYVCLDLHKYDEAIQACHFILDLKAEKGVAEGVPGLEEKCVRGLVGGALRCFRESKGDEAALESSRRTLDRVDGLLNRISSTAQSEPWVFETVAFFQEHLGQDEKVLENLMKEYRSLQSVQGWEKDDAQVKRICQVVAHIATTHRRDGSRESLVKGRFLVRGLVKSVRSARQDDVGIPDDVEKLEAVLNDFEAQLKNI